MRYQRYIMIYFCFLELEFSRFFGRIHHYHFLLRIMYIMELLYRIRENNRNGELLTQYLVYFAFDRL